MSSEATRTIATEDEKAAIPQPRPQSGTYVAETYTGDVRATPGGVPALANDGEPAGLARVRLAMRPDPQRPPAPGRLAGLCAWAAVIALIGLILGIRSGFAAVGGAPGWFVPLAVLTGLIGFGSTVASFFTAHHPRMPWILLGIASVTLIIATVLVDLT